MTLDSKKVLVTGGAGFIGSHLTEELLNRGYQVTVLDNFSNGRRENLNFARNAPSLTIHDVDIADGADAVKEYFKDAEWVFHLAGLADIVPSIEKPLEYHRSNVDGTFAVLEASRACGVKRFIYAASSSCYGLPDQFPTPETAAIKPMYPYALSKRLGEEYVLHWNKVYGLPAISLRLFNVYGPRSRTTGAYGAVFGVFLAQKLAGRPFTVVGDGTQTRDFTYVTDVTNAFITAAESNVSEEIFNVGSDNTYSINELVERLGGEIEYIPKRPGEPDCTWAEISKIKSTLGWSPKVTFAEGVKKMLTHIEDWRNAPVWDKISIGKATETWFQHLSSKD